MAQSGCECLPRMQNVGCSNPSRNRPKSQKQVVTTPLPNVRRASRVLGDAYNFKQIPRVTVGVRHLKILTVQFP